MEMPRTLKKFNVFIDGVGHRGTVSEVALPELAKKMEDFRSGGMDAPLKIAMGMEPLMATFTFPEYDEQVLIKVGLFGVANVPFTLRGAVPRSGDNDLDALAVVVSMRGQFTKVELGSWKAGELSEVKYECALSYYKLTYDGQEIYDIDILNMKRVIHGVDQLASMRAAIGL